MLERPLGVRILHGAILLVMLGPATGPLGAQCRTADYDGTRFVEIVRRHADAFSLAPSGPADTVTRGERAPVRPELITSADSCARASTAYRSAANGDLSTLSGQVYVVRSGDHWFVWDPAYRFHSESPFVYMRFDAAWRLQRKFELD